MLENFGIALTDPDASGRYWAGTRWKSIAARRRISRSTTPKFHWQMAPGLPVFQDYRCQMQVRPTRNSHDPRQYLFRGVRQGFAIDE